VSKYKQLPNTNVNLPQLIEAAEQIHNRFKQRQSDRTLTGNRVDADISNDLEQIPEILDQLRTALSLLEAERENLEALAQIGQVINSSLDLAHVLTEVIDMIISLTGAERAFLMLRPEGEAEMSIVSARNWEQETLGPGEHEISLTVIGEVMSLAEAVITTNAQADPRFDHQQSVITYSLRSILCVPLKVKEKLIGVIYADHRLREGLFDEHDRQVMTAFANQAAVAIDNAQLYETVLQHADDMELRVLDRTAELAEANRHLRALSRLKDEFVANVSHELRTPITSIRLYASLLEKPSPKASSYLESIKRETGRLEQIINNLLRLASLDQERDRVKTSAVKLNDLALALVDDRQSIAHERNLILSFKGQEQLPDAGADKQLITEALSILLTNALNYTPSGGSVEVQTLTVDAADGCWLGLSVADTGPGIPDDEKLKIFRRFYRGSVGQSSGKSGTGLGLAIVKEITDLHHGKIEVGSSDGHETGATFRLWLPVERRTR
jgi:signal transduction histidine kinase